MDNKLKYSVRKSRRGEATASNKASKSRHQSENQFEVESLDLGSVCTSAKKLKLPEDFHKVGVD